MTVDATPRKAGPYDGNDVATDFAFSFKVYDSTDVLVIHADEDGVETTWALDTDYTVTMNADQDSSPGGTVYATAALPTDEKIVILGSLPLEQDTDLTNGGNFQADNVEGLGDKATILSQQHEEKLQRALLFQPSQDAASTAAATPASFSATRVLKLKTEDGEVVYVPAALVTW